VSASKASATEHDPGRLRDLGIGKAVRVSGAVDALVAPAGDLPHERVDVGIGEDEVRADGMLLHHVPSGVRQRARLVEDGLGDPDPAESCTDDPISIAASSAPV